MGLFYDICPKCGNKVSKRARFCSECGNGAPEGWIKCPQCNQWVGNDSEYCPHCTHPLHPKDRINLAGGIWDRSPECVAQRFELNDVRFINEKGLLIQEGTSAILLEDGKVVKVLTAGKYTPSGSLLGNPPARSAVMIDSGDMVFRVNFDNNANGGGTNNNLPILRSAEELEVCAVAEITLRFDPTKAAAFMQNFIKDLRQFTVKDVCGLIYQEAFSTVRDLCNQSSIEDLVKDPLRRERFEEAIARALSEPLARNGFMLVRVGAVEFYGEAYEELREKFGELEEKRRLAEYDNEQLKLLAQIDAQNKAHESGQAQRDVDFEKEKQKRIFETEEYLKQLAQEKELGDISRNEELQIAVLVSKGKISAEEAKQKLARQAEEHIYALRELTNKIELENIQDNFIWEKRIKELKNQQELAEIQNKLRLANAEYNKLIAEQEALARRTHVDTDIYEATKWWELKEKIKQAKQNRRIAWANVIRDYPIEKIIAVTEDPAVREDLIKIYHEQVYLKQLSTQSTMTPQQLMALGANNSNAAIAQANANAMARMAEAGEQASQKALALYREVENANNQRIDNFVKQIHEIALESVKHQSTTIVPPSTPVTNMQH